MGEILNIKVTDVNQDLDNEEDYLESTDRTKPSKQIKVSTFLDKSTAEIKVISPKLYNLDLGCTLKEINSPEISIRMSNEFLLESSRMVETVEESKQQYEVLVLKKVNPLVQFNILGDHVKSSDILIGNALLLATS
jgi:hypothetical protein